MLKKHIFRAYDIRGIVGEDFDAEGARVLGKSYVQYLQKHDGIQRPKIVVGRDGRISSPEMQAAFIAGARAAGANVVDAGLSTSPMLFFAICVGGFGGGVNVTASHNPRDYNGFKLQRRNSESICGKEIQAIWQIVESGDYVESDEAIGDLESRSFKEEYFAKLKTLVDIPGKPKVVFDAGNGVTGAYLEELFADLACEVIPLFTEVDGSFPNHDADPEVESNLEELKKTVLAEKANLGIAFDGDGDRVGVVDESGHHYSADLLLLLLARDLLSRHKSKIVIDLKATQVLFDEINKLGGEGIMVQTGHSFVEAKMKATGALLGGEVSGHIFFAENYYGFDDAFLAAGKLIEIISKAQKPMAEHFAALPKVYNTPEIKVECAEDQKFTVIKKLQKHFLAKYGEAKCLTIDGVRIDFGAGAWGIVRASNTSPKITLRFEAKSEEKLNEIKAEVMEALENEMDNV